jgi:hypothetical protein
VTDINNNRILNDTPVVIIQNTQNNMYFNGITWQSSIAQLVMPHIADGVYSKSITFEESGVYRATIRSDTYSIEKIETIDVYDSNLIRYSWLLNSNFTVKYVGITDNDIVNVRIKRDIDAMNWSGTEWISTETLLSMSLLSDNVYTYTFLPDVESQYSITITSGENELFYIISVTATGSDIAPAFIDHATFYSVDGTDSTTVDENNNKMPNVIITAFNPTTKAVVAKTLSNSLGEWNMMLTPGEYYFMFEKEGYMSVGFERTVL